MCGPSSALKSLAASATSFAGQVQQQATQVFGSASAVFNNLIGSVQSVVKGGPGQAGWGAAETNAVNSQILNNAAVSARNEKSAVGNAVAAIGGGNTVNPSGLETAVNLQTAQSVENAKSQQEEQATVANYQQGNQNYNAAVTEEMQLPKVFDASSAADKAATDASAAATADQTAISAANNWWQPILGSAIGVGGDIATGGLSGAAKTAASAVNTGDSTTGAGPR